MEKSTLRSVSTLPGQTQPLTPSAQMGDRRVGACVLGRKLHMQCSSADVAAVRSAADSFCSERS